MPSVVVLQHRGAGAVGEQHGHVAVGPVDPAREVLRADHEDPPVAGLEQSLGGAHRVHEAAAGGVDVHRRTGEPQVVGDHGPRWPGRSGRAWWSRGRGSRCRSGSTPASSMALRPAMSAERHRAEPPMRRSRMPVRSVIHSSDVSSVEESSSLVTMRSGNRDAPALEANAHVSAPFAGSSAHSLGRGPSRPTGAARTCSVQRATQIRRPSFVGEVDGPDVHGATLAQRRRRRGEDAARAWSAGESS